MAINKEFLDKALKLLDESPNKIIGTEHTPKAGKLFNEYPIIDIKDSLDSLDKSVYETRMYDSFERAQFTGFGLRLVDRY